MKLGLVISTLTCGGAERVLSTLANEWARRGHAVRLITLDAAPPFFELDPRVELRQLDTERPSASPWSAWRQLRSTKKALAAALTSLDAVIAFTTRVNVKVLMATHRLGIPVVISERVDPTAYHQGRLWKFLVRRWYPRATALVVQGRAIAREFQSHNRRVVIIPNPLEPVEISRPPQADSRFHWIAVARLTRQKGLDLLLRAWSLCETRAVSDLTILGDGEDRATLAALAEELAVQDSVRWAGFVSDKEPYWRRSDAFVLSSRFEGFPNALCEAMSVGLPSVAFDCPSGPRDIIENGRNGLLVPAEDVQSLAKAMDRVASEPRLREQLSTEAMKIRETLGLAGVVDQWEKVLGL